MSDIFFHQSSEYTNHFPGYVFKKGDFGLGYYKDKYIYREKKLIKKLNIDNQKEKEYVFKTINKLKNEWFFCNKCSVIIGTNIEAAELIEKLYNQLNLLRKEKNN